MSESKLKRSEKLNLYAPVLLALIFLLYVGALYLTNASRFSLFVASVLGALTFLVFGLHRVHEYKYGFTVKTDGKNKKRLYTSTAYSSGFVLFMFSIRFDSVIVAIMGAIVIVATAALSNHF